MKSRNLHIDSLRGIACILLVAFHTIGDPNSGLKIEEGLYRTANDIMAYIRMPLFTFLSGFVYAYRPYTGEAFLFIKGKARRLLIPMLTAGTAFAVLQSIMSGANAPPTNWYMLHIFPVAHYWFIESLFFIFLLMIPIETLKLLDSKIKFSALLVVSILLYLSNIFIPYFSINGAIYLLPYFLLGVACRNYSISSKFNVSSSAILNCLLIIVLAAIILNNLSDHPKRTLLTLFISTISCLALLSLKIKSIQLSRIGLSSYSIYLYHVFFTAGGRIFLSKLGVTDINILFTFSLILGLFGPIFVEIIFNKTNFTRVAFLGKSILSKKEKTKI